MGEDDLVDTFLDLAARFELADGPAEAEREKVTEALEAATKLGLAKKQVSDRIATFCGTVPDAGLKTNRNNELVLTVVVAWEDRAEVYRMLDTIPMTLIFAVEKPGAD